MALVVAAALVGPVEAAPPAGAAVAAGARAVLRKHCKLCHGSDKEAKAGLYVLDPGMLTGRGLVKPGNPDSSELLQLVECGSMPPGTRPKLASAERQALRDWIAGGAGPFPAETGEAYVVRSILEDVQRRRADPAALVASRYVSFNHLWTGLDSSAEPYRDALLKAVNHLSWKPLARPEAIDSSGTIFRLDLRDLGWDLTPFDGPKAPGEKDLPRINLFDLILLEYPLASLTLLPEGPDKTAAEYLKSASLARPVLYVQGDWLVSIATQPPLYDDLLRLPRTLSALEERLAIPGQRAGRAAWAGLGDSAVSRRNRLVERVPLADGAYWRTYELGTAGKDELAKGATTPTAPGVMLFSLPNRLNGYFIAGLDGRRLDTPADGIPADPVARDGLARNGLSCIRCHDAGVKPFTDAARAALERSNLGALEKDRLLTLYPGPATMDGHLAGDRRRFTAALEALLGHAPAREALTPLTREYLGRQAAVPELSPHFVNLTTTLFYADDVAPRAPAWEKLAPGPRLLPLDGLTFPDYRPLTDPLSVTLATVNLKTRRPTSIFKAGDELVVEVTNKGTKEIFFELISATMNGRRDVRQAVRKLLPGQTYRYPRDRERNPREFIPIDPEPGKDQYVLFAAAGEFPGGIRLRGADLGDRILHAFYELSPDDTRAVARFDPARLLKKTVVIETQAP
jgi:serine/threonine-protein kinase